MSAETKPIVSRAQAIERGLSRYYTGRPCAREHISERMTSNRGCLVCQRLRTKLWNRSTPERRKIKNRKQTIWSSATPERRRARYLKAKRRILTDAQRAARAAAYLKYKNKRSNVQVRIAALLRKRFASAIKSGSRNGSAVRDLGCSIAEFKEYIAAKFVPGMSWENWGTEWQLDHIKPLRDFNLSDRDQCVDACHFTNLQPLLVADHRRKSAAESAARNAARVHPHSCPPGVR